jgi:hypothetical protein
MLNYRFQLKSPSRLRTCHGRCDRLSKSGVIQVLPRYPLLPLDCKLPIEIYDHDDRFLNAYRSRQTRQTSCFSRHFVWQISISNRVGLSAAAGFIRRIMGALLG